RTLSPEEVKNNFNNELKRFNIDHEPEGHIADGLILHYDFKNKYSASKNRDTVKDLSGNGNDGQLYNFTHGGDTIVGDSSIYTGEGLAFDDIDDGLLSVDKQFKDIYTMETTFTYRKKETSHVYSIMD